MSRHSRSWFLLVAGAMVLTIIASGLSFPRSIGLRNSAALERISHGEGLLYEAPWPKDLRHPRKRTLLPNDTPEVTENGRALIHSGAKRKPIEQQGGRFRITGSKVQFSSFDGTSPLDNRKTYVVSSSTLRVSEWLLVALWSAALLAWLPLAFRCGKLSFRLAGRFVEGASETYRQLAIRGLLPGSSVPLLERFNKLLLPIPFFAGVAIGLALCILGGRLAARANTFADRSRFFYQISPEGYVYPTLENLLQFVRERAAHDKILVLSAGSSISLGVGQQNGHLWTNRLQTELGDQFSVVNLSFRSAKFTSIGLPIMEILSREYPRLLFVTETRPGYAPDWMQYDFGSYAYPYNYLIVQAWLSGKLLSNPIRDEKVRAALQSADELTQLRAREDLIRALLERVTSASDLWNYLSYKYFFTVFSPVQSPNFPFWIPRSELPDDESSFVFDPEGLKAREAHELRILKGAYVERVDMAQNELQLSDTARQSFTAIEKAIPDLTLRARTLFLVTTRNPVLTEQLSSTDRQRYQLSVFDWSQKLTQAGFASLPVGMNYQGEDFIDAHHFSNKGGARMASEIAPIIRQMAEKNGWLDQTIK